MRETRDERRETYLFGPVPSRRLGLSLGVDIVPFKICPLDCIYCQLGPTTEKTVERAEYVRPESVLAELKEKLSQGLKADYITLSGSGEPTLNTKIGEVIIGIKKLTDIPVAVLTNGVLMTEKQVRCDCARADIILPSLDAGDQRTFEQINRPHKKINFEQFVEGLCALRAEFTGRIWLEVFMVEGVTIDTPQIDKIAKIVERIGPDKVQLNTAVRPAADVITRVEFERLSEICEKFGKNCEIIADFSPPGTADIETGIEELSMGHFAGAHMAESLLSMLKRRPCTLDEVCSALAIHRGQAIKYLSHLRGKGLIESVEKDGATFFKAL